jgi:serralysin
MAKPVWTTDQVVAQLTNWGAQWDNSTPVPYMFYAQSAEHHLYKQSFGAFSEAERQSLLRSMQLVSDVAKISFVNIAPGTQPPSKANPFLGFYTMNDSSAPFWGTATGYASEGDTPDPSGELYGADILVNRHQSNNGAWGFGTVNSEALLHELLHGIGLDHAGDWGNEGAFDYENQASYYQDTVQYTVMSYWPAFNTGADHVTTVLHLASTPLLYDVAALQALYGANMSTRTGNTVYGFNNSSGRDAFDLAKNPAAVFTIWDAAGVDTLDLSGYSTASRVDLREGAFSDAGGMTLNISIARGATIENAVGGAGDDALTGNQAANRLTGGAGNDSLSGREADDILEGGVGSDTMTGGAGNDTYSVDNAGDKVVETSGTGGTDTVRSSISFTLGNFVERLVLTGAGPTNGTGNNLGNSLTGNAAANALDGGAGNDVLDGGAGADTMTGGSGADLFRVDAAGDKAIETSTTGGTDTVQSAVTFTLGANVEKLELSGSEAVNGTGNGLANNLTGNRAANSLNGAAGADTMAGGAGNDIYFVDNAGDKVVETSLVGGSDTVRSAIGYTLGANVEHLVLTGGGTVNGAGNGLANRITGNGAANILKGGSGADTLDAAAGSDRLFGGSGNDSLKGGGGADEFTFDSALGSSNVDAILDYYAPSDSIFLSRAIFTAAGPNGRLSSAAFHAGTAAADGSDRIVYDQGTGRIFYDADGSGAKAQILFATVTPGTALGYSDFVIYG